MFLFSINMDESCIIDECLSVPVVLYGVVHHYLDPDDKCVVSVSRSTTLQLVIVRWICIELAKLKFLVYIAVRSSSIDLFKGKSLYNPNCENMLLNQWY